MEFYGQGVSYCATCDGNFYKGLSVAVVGGGNTAITEALYLADLCLHVHILVRGERTRAEDIWIDKANTRDNITFHYNTQVAEVRGDMMGVKELLLNHTVPVIAMDEPIQTPVIPTQAEVQDTLKVDGVFVAIGSTPFTKIVDSLNAHKDAEGCLIVDKRQETSVK